MNRTYDKLLVATFLLGCVLPTALSAQWKVGVAKQNVTPTEAVLLAGYGSRTKPSEGIDSPLWARALAIGDTQPHVVIAVDNCGVPAEMTERVYARVNARKKIARPAFVICSTHTHNAPALPGYAPVLWLERAGEAEWGAVERYAKVLEDHLVVLALDVLTNQVDASLAWQQGTVTFGGNRRVLEAGSWRNFGFQRDGPVDHSLPMLVARDSQDKVLAVWTNYACHCTTVGDRNRVGGDWAGCANAEIERRLEGAIALTTIGCGADVGPQPTGTLDFAAQHGQAIADEIHRLISAAALRPLGNALTSNSTTVALPFADIQNESYWQERAKLRGFDGVHGRQMLQQLRQHGSLPRHLEYCITTWQFGRELAIVFLPGEVCVDYAVRLKTENDWRRLWINGWSNDVPCYIPSRRVLSEGGYEADFSMIYYNRPGRFSDAVEDTIVAAVTLLLNDRFPAPADREPPGIFAQPARTTADVPR